jgi:Tfp pilus assembly protein PilO
MGVILLVGAAIIAVGLAVYFYKRKQAAEVHTCQNSAMLSDFMAAEMAMKASQLESYKAMLRQPNPQPQPRRNNPRGIGIDWEYVADDNPRRF